MTGKNKFLAEKYLMDTLDRMSRNPTSLPGYSVVHVKVSRLKPQNRHPSFVNVLMRFFDAVISATKTSFFKLSNGDFVILGRNINILEVKDTSKKIKQGFASDPIVHSSDMNDFIAIYDFPNKFEYFYNYIEDVIFNINSEIHITEAVDKRPIEASYFDAVVKFIDQGVNLSEIIKRQGCFRYSSDGEFKTLFQEFYVAIKDLDAKFGENISLVANKWLFIYLSSFLDKKTLSSFFVSNITKWPEYIAINLNVSSVFTHEFVDFAKRFLKQHQKIIVEVKITDILNNLETYREAKNILRRGENKILIDEVPISMFSMVKIEEFKPDFIKIFWEPLMEYDLDNQGLKKAISRIGHEKFILAKCNTKKAIEWGRLYGIENFQGPCLDELEIEKLKLKCGDKECKADCFKLRKLTSGAFGDSCSTRMVFEDYI